ncbi:MAG TPA: NAD(P)-dependent oxidoreductase [Longilinea sp.]|nr:NAD(P)-dependent oxidoreductase [Longilinea sp.]
MHALKILVTEPENYSLVALETYRLLGQVDLGPLDDDGLAGKIAGYDVLVIRLGHIISRVLMEKADELKVIVSPTTGLDHIDLEAAAEKNITVLSLKGETEFLRSIPATAELTWGLLLALVRHIPQAYPSVLKGEWQRDRFRGHDLSGKTLGIVGLGRIGEKTARYGQAFGMRVIAFDPYRTEWPTGVEKMNSLKELLRRSEVLLVHVPLEKDTVGMFGAKELSLLPPGAVLVNTSRGAVLDEAALLQALGNGHLAGAALDVVQNEAKFGVRSPLVRYAKMHGNLLLTPHLGGATVESMAMTEAFMADKLKRFLTAERK